MVGVLDIGKMYSFMALRPKVHSRQELSYSRCVAFTDSFEVTSFLQ